MSRGYALRRSWLSVALTLWLGEWGIANFRTFGPAEIMHLRNPFPICLVLVNDKNPRTLITPRPTFSLAALEAACCSSHFCRWHVSMLWNRYCQLQSSAGRSTSIGVDIYIYIRGMPLMIHSVTSAVCAHFHNSFQLNCWNMMLSLSQ